jgi:hypothetical protein
VKGAVIRVLTLTSKCKTSFAPIKDSSHLKIVSNHPFLILTPNLTVSAKEKLLQFHRCKKTETREQPGL